MISANTCLHYHPSEISIPGFLPSLLQEQCLLYVGENFLGKCVPKHFPPGRFFIEKSMSCSTELALTHKRLSVHILATCNLIEQSLGFHYFSFNADDLNMHFSFVCF